MWIAEKWEIHGSMMTSKRFMVNLNDDFKRAVK
jgi:hypothetical protein